MATQDSSGIVPAQPATIGTTDVNVSVPSSEDDEPQKRFKWLPRTRISPMKILMIVLVILVIILLILLIAICAIYVGVTCARPRETMEQVTPVTGENITGAGTQKPHRGGVHVMAPDFKAYKVCRKEACQREAEYFKKTMDLSANPCEDFYTYVCGGWMKKTYIPKERGRWTKMDMIRSDLTKKGIELLENPEIRKPKGAVENAKAFYQGCVDTEDIDETKGKNALLKIVREVGGFPLLSVYNKHLKWTERVVSVYRELGYGYLIIFDVAVDENDTSKHAIYLDQMENFGIDRGILIHPDKDQQSRNVMKAYKEFIVSCICFFRPSCSRRERKTIEPDVSKIIKFESNIAKLTRPPEERRDAFANYNRVTLKKLAKIAHKIPFYTFFHHIFEGTDQKVDESLEMVLREEKYFADLGELMKTVSRETVANYLGWRILQALGPMACPSLRKHQFIFHKVTTGIKRPAPIEEKCFASTNKVFDYAVGSIYVKEYFPASAKRHMEELVGYLRRAFEKILNETTWMDHNTSKEALKKLEEMQQKIGFPEWILDKAALDKHFALPKPVRREEFILSYNDIQRVLMKQNLKKLHQPFNRTSEWSTAPAVVNAFYNQIENSITFPAGILNQPFFQHGVPRVFNYGGIGVVIGHEITHGFDDVGSQYDSKGNLRNWRSNATVMEFNKKKECFIEQYSNLTEPLTNMTVNGRNTIGENIADNGGIREAFLAYTMDKKSRDIYSKEEVRLPGLENITSDQWFFIASANVWCVKERKESLRHHIMDDEHTPGQFRAIIPQSNHEEFAKAFNCPLGSQMNPKKKCVLW